MCLRLLVAPASWVNSTGRWPGWPRGEPWFVQIVGEPGIGKSRLLGELCLRGEQRGYLVLEGRAAEFERDIPFGLIVDALNDYVGALEPAMLRALDEDTVQELASIFPSLPTPDGGSASGGRGAERYRLHYAIRSLLERLDQTPAGRARLRRCSLGRRGVGRDAHPPAAPLPRSAPDGGRLPPVGRAPARRAGGHGPTRVEHPVRAGAAHGGAGEASHRPRRRRHGAHGAVSGERRQPLLPGAAGSLACRRAHGRRGRRRLAAVGAPCRDRRDPRGAAGRVSRRAPGPRGWGRGR